MKQLWNWAKVKKRDRRRDPISGAERCTYFEKELWFKFGNSMWRKQILYHVQYIYNVIVDPFRVSILR